MIYPSQKIDEYNFSWWIIEQEYVEYVEAKCPDKWNFDKKIFSKIIEIV